MDEEHGSLVRRWEALPAQVQAAIVFPPAAVVLALLHLALFDLPVALVISYGIFWGGVVTALVVMASRAERARRAERDRQQGLK
ncbi:MAG TPA: hypothetical protein VKD47_04600 [Miltoncostaeaceae bacterium]|nr:hypothetical protein [Miltoncostaeaceae bacterium]